MWGKKMLTISFPRAAGPHTSFWSALPTIHSQCFASEKHHTAVSPLILHVTQAPVFTLQSSSLPLHPFAPIPTAFTSLPSHMFISSHRLPCALPFHQLSLTVPLSLLALGSIGVQRTRPTLLTPHSITTDMSDSETTAAPTEAPVPAACTSIKADLDKW